MSDRFLSDLLSLEIPQTVTLHIQSVDQAQAIKTVKRKITDIQSMKINEQMKAVKSGYDIDLLPSDLMTYGGEAQKLLQELQSRNERMFLMTFIVMNIADGRKQLDNAVCKSFSECFQSPDYRES